MALRINFNYASLQAQRGLSGAEKIAQRAGSQLSSGLRINQAADDTAGIVDGIEPVEEASFSLRLNGCFGFGPAQSGHGDLLNI